MGNDVECPITDKAGDHHAQADRSDDGARRARGRWPGGSGYENREHLRLRLLAEVDHDHRGRHRDVHQQGHDGEPPVLASKGEFVSPILHHNTSYSFTFRAAGFYRYSDELHPKLTGSITVKGLPPSVTLGASAPIISAGTELTVSGVVSNHKAGESVSIYYRPYPQPNLIQRATILTSDGGNYSFIVAPGILTTYEALWKGAFSAPVTVQVQPSLSLGRNNGWIVHASASHSFAGRSVQIQRLNGTTGQWVTLAKVQLNSKSSARVTLDLPKGVNRLRVTMSVNQAGAGYLGVIGPTLTWHQT